MSDTNLKLGQVYSFSGSEDNFITVGMSCGLGEEHWTVGCRSIDHGHKFSISARSFRNKLIVGEIVEEDDSPIPENLQRELSRDI